MASANGASSISIIIPCHRLAVMENWLIMTVGYQLKNAC
ncbi:MGMT family protein [Candidatus Ruthia endofausta]|nr:MGMT family protein [Candidatus Ruthia endofausta]